MPASTKLTQALVDTAIAIVIETVADLLGRRAGGRPGVIIDEIRDAASGKMPPLKM